MLHGQDWDFKYTRGPWGNIESCRIEVKNRMQKEEGLP